MRTSSSSFTRALITLGKFGLAGATICAVAWASLTLDPRGEVQDSQADIVDFSFFTPETSTQKFVSALDRLGHEPPRVYNYNGTQIFFSTRTTSKPPLELIDEYQQMFVERGVNAQPWGTNADAVHLKNRAAAEAQGEKMSAAMLNGEVGVLYHDEGSFIMSGAMVDFDGLKLMKTSDTRDHLNALQNRFKMHRYLQADWDPVHKETTVTATWSDEHFEFYKTLPTQNQSEVQRIQNNATDLDVPSCIGCTRLTRFATEANDKPYVKQIFSSPSSTEEVTSFYNQVMTARGWQDLTADHALNTFGDPSISQDGRALLFTRDGRFLTVVVSPNETGPGSFVSTITTD